ncbi:hypothetical protein [Paraglaciecola chathamensis]|uniref:hypothetical protein n=1 Tax=Paraglaciecola chathamensis TaxID=368405 RepID=UPI002705E1C9|nr:hypothetical protein [Paraglaciecola chathamensis]MDO6557621.1 hypothetical protein [Paraglaciecola chathamensis]
MEKLSKFYLSLDRHRMEDSIERIIAHRDKFQAWGSVLSILSLLAAVWVTAPTLQVDIPLAGGAKANINAGYIIALAPVFIAFSQLWALGSLVSMRRYQLEIINLQTDISPTTVLSVLGPLSIYGDLHRSEYSPFIRLVNSARRGRSIVFFLIPAIAQIIILSHMFNNLMYFDKEKEIVRFEKLDENGKLSVDNWSIETKKVNLIETLFSKYPEGGNNYTLQNSGLNEFCGAYIYLSHLKKLNDRNESQKEVYAKLKEADLHCVPIEFPKFELALNSWINIFMIFLSFYVSWVGARYYSGRGIMISNNLRDSK